MILWLHTLHLKQNFGVSINGIWSVSTVIGIIPSDAPIEHVVLRAYWNAPDYLRTLPQHESQKELQSDEGSTTFSYDVKLTYDFMQLIMQQGDQVEILEPKKLRDQMRNLAKTLTSYYK